MKKLYLFLLASSMFTAGFAQQTERIGRHNTPASWTPTTQSGFTSTSEAQHYAQQIVDVVGLKANFELVAARVENAAAVTYGGKRYVLYNPNFIHSLVQKTGNKWAAISVLAHEIGHHLNGHTVTGQGSQPGIELEADEFSGFVLRKLGASLTDAQAAMKVLAGVTASRTHPAQYDRLTSIERGWRHGGGEKMRDVAKAPVPQPQTPVVQQPVPQQKQVPVMRTPATARAIIGTVRFDANPYNRYFVTDNYQLVQVQNQQVKSIARVARSNSRQFPYVIYDEQNTQLLVSAQGGIYTRSGRQVGSMQAYNG